MLVACWSVKGGAGVSVVAASLAKRLASDHGGALLVDLGGDQPDLTGVPAHHHAGVSEWLAAGEDAPVDALARLEVQLPGGVSLLTRGHGPLEPGPRLDVLLALLGGAGRPAVVDCGTPLAASALRCGAGDVALATAAAATRSLLVIRPCVVSLRRAMGAPLRPSGVVVVSETGRALDGGDVAQVLDVEIVAEVAVDPAVARVVDAGLLLARPPRPLQRGLRHAA